MPGKGIHCACGDVLGRVGARKLRGRASSSFMRSRALITHVASTCLQGRHSGESASAAEARFRRVLSRAASRGVDTAAAFMALDKDDSGALSAAEFMQVPCHLLHAAGV